MHAGEPEWPQPAAAVPGPASAPGTETGWGRADARLAGAQHPQGRAQVTARLCRL